jgi:hypothetical protein
LSDIPMSANGPKFDLPLLTDEHVNTVCLPGKGMRTCRYLTVISRGWQCAKLMPDLADVINERVARETMVARGDNCEGRANHWTTPVA